MAGLDGLIFTLPRVAAVLVGVRATSRRGTVFIIATSNVSRLVLCQHRCRSDKTVVQISFTPIIFSDLWLPIGSLDLQFYQPSYPQLGTAV